MRIKTGENGILLVVTHLIFYTTEDNDHPEASIQMEMERLAASITQILFLNGSTCQDMVWRGAGSNHTKVFPWEETLPSSANFLLRVYSISFFFLLSVSQTRRKTGRGQKKESLTRPDRAHVCFLKKRGQYQRGPCFIDEERLRSCASIVGVCADVGCDSHSACLNCLCLCENLHNKRILP